MVKGTKARCERRIAFDPETANALCAFRRSCEERAAAAGRELGQSAFVFTTALDGSRLRRPDGMSLAFIRLRRRAGVKELPLHSLRHFAATRMLAAGVPVRTVAGRLGQANPATTLNVYSHWVAQSGELAASVLAGLLDSGDDLAD